MDDERFASFAIFALFTRQQPCFRRACCSLLLCFAVLVFDWLVPAFAPGTQARMDCPQPRISNGTERKADGGIDVSLDDRRIKVSAFHLFHDRHEDRPAGKRHEERAPGAWLRTLLLLPLSFEFRLGLGEPAVEFPQALSFLFRVALLIFLPGNPRPLPLFGKTSDDLFRSESRHAAPRAEARRVGGWRFEHRQAKDFAKLLELVAHGARRREKKSEEWVVGFPSTGKPKTSQSCLSLSRTAR